MESKAILVKRKIEDDFGKLDEKEIERYFETYLNDKRALSFTKFYNKTVLDKAKIRFSTFSYQWALHLPRKFYSYFDENYDRTMNEIKSKKNIVEFHNRFCIDNSGKQTKKRGSFCSKLFHTFLPLEFPPVDNPIRKGFNLQREDFIQSVLIIKRGYELFINENPDLMNLIRRVLSKTKFDILRINEISNMRILDMFYWFKENRQEKSSDSERPHHPRKVTSDDILHASPMVSQEALTRLLVQKGIVTREELLSMLKVVDEEMREKEKWKVRFNEDFPKSKSLEEERNVTDASVYIMRLIETHENRSRPKGRHSLSDEQSKLYELIKSMAGNRSDGVVFRNDITDAYRRKFHTGLNLLATDFCYNSVNRGPDFEPKFLLKQERGKFKFVDFGWPSNDQAQDIEWQPKGSDVPEGLRGKVFRVGTYHKGEYCWDFYKELSEFL